MHRNRSTALSTILAIALFIGFTCAQNQRVEAAEGAPNKSVSSEQASQTRCTGTVVDAQGRSLAGVKVTLHEMVQDERTHAYEAILLGEVKTGTDGAFRFNETIDSNRYQYGFIVAEKEGLALGFDNWPMRDGDKEVEIRLGPPKELAGTVVDEKGVPVADAQVSVSMLALGEGSGRPGLGGFVATKLLTTDTDAAGKFAFTRIPTGATAEFIVSKTGRATVSTHERQAAAYQKLNFAEGQEDIKLVLPAEAKIEGVIVEKSTGKPVGGVKIRCSSGQEMGYFRPKPVTSKENGTISFEALSATRYLLELVNSRDELPDWVTDPVEVIAETGKTHSDIKIELSKGGVLEVKVTDAASKEPVEKANVRVMNSVNNRTTYAYSDKSGTARMRLMSGDYRVSYVTKQGYSSQRFQDAVSIEHGKIERQEYGLVSMPRIVGVVRDEKGAPLEFAEMEMCPAGGIDESVSDAEGRFELIYDSGSRPGGRTPTLFLVGRHEERNLAAAVQVDEDTSELNVKLEPAVTIYGKIVDPNGKGIADVEVRTMLQGPQWGSTIGRKPALTDPQGNYEITALPPKHEYKVYARAEGYGEKQSGKTGIANAGDNRLDTGTLTLARANLSVSGVVVDEDDKPVVGARVSCSGDGQPYRRARTDTQGRFVLDMVCAGVMRINADKSGAIRLYGNTEAEGGATDVRIVIGKRSVSGRSVQTLPRSGAPKRPASSVYTGQAFPVKWPVTEGGNGHSYLAIATEGAISWTDASEVAKALGGHLVTLTSAAENDFVFHLIDSDRFWHHGYNFRGSWIGGYQLPGASEPDGGWAWVTGEPFVFEFWAPRAPNNWGGVNENRIHFGTKRARVKTWNDIIDDFKEVRSYVVEFSEARRFGIPVKWSKGDGGNGHSYLAVTAPDGVTWLEANRTARSVGGHLATITSQEENDFVSTLIDNEVYWSKYSQNTKAGPWIGGYRPFESVERTDGWRWVTDEPLTYVNRRQGRPDGPPQASGAKKGLHFLQLMTGGFPTTVWNDLPEDYTGVHGYVIEFLPGHALPTFEGIDLDFDPSQAGDQMILLCFWDLDQRPSRYCVRELAQRAQELKGKDIAVVAVATSQGDGSAVAEWVKRYEIPFPVGTIQGDAEKVRLRWGVESLPWLILTDTDHLVRAEGFTLQELDEKQEQILAD